jgi:cobalt ECF transporter T component CbiQ
VSIALAIQALFFADGGVLAFAMNSFTMAFAMPVCGYAAYRIIAAGSSARSHRRIIAAGIGGWFGLNVAAFLTAVFLGIQPALARHFGGTYFPLGLRVTIPALMIPHMAIGGVAEGIITAAAFRALLAAGVGERSQAPRARIDLLWLGIAVLVALAPLGILAKGEAWGEGGVGGVGQHDLLAGPLRFHPVMPGYLSARGPFFYVLAGTVGIAVIAAALLLAGNVLARGRKPLAVTPPSIRRGEIPAWLIAGGAECESHARSLRSSWRSRRFPFPRADFITRTLRALTLDARETLFAERWAREKGILQRVPPAAKLLIVLAIVVAAAFLQSPVALGALCLLAFGLGLVSRIPAATFAKRVWLAVPLFVGAFALPAVLSWVTPGKALIVLTRDPELSITRPGVECAAILVLRVGAAVSFVVLLALTTRWRDLIAAFRVIHLPAPLVDLLAMTHRYAALLTRAAAEVFTARRSRAVGHGNAGEGRSFVASAVAGLFAKSIALSDDVHAAMVSRGWQGRGR